MKIGSLTATMAAGVVILLLLGSSNSRAQMSERCEIAPGTNYVYVPPEVTVYSDRSRLTIYLSTNRESLSRSSRSMNWVETSCLSCSRMGCLCGSLLRDPIYGATDL